MGDFSNFGSLKSTETSSCGGSARASTNFSNFGSLKSTETVVDIVRTPQRGPDFSNFGSLKSTETSSVLS